MVAESGKNGMNGDGSGARILVVDDSADMVYLLERLLEADGYTEVVSTTDPTRVVDLYRAFHPDLILLDLHMPKMNGLDVIAALKTVMRDEFLPIVMLTGDVSGEAKLRALGNGARDFLTKPFDKTEVHLRIKNLLELRELHQSLRQQNEVLEQKVSERTRDLARARVEILQRLARAAEFRDDNTGEHAQRVGRVCELLAQQLGLSPRDVEIIKDASPLHDVGKIAVPDNILLKDGPLTEDEWAIMRRHTRIGARLLANSISPTLRLGQKIAFAHHERWDGTGYEGLTREAIPLCGRVVAVADAYDAMTHHRPYKEAMRSEDALAELERHSGDQFDPLVVEAFFAVCEENDLEDTLELGVQLAP